VLRGPQPQPGAGQVPPQYPPQYPPQPGSPQPPKDNRKPLIIALTVALVVIGGGVGLLFGTNFFKGWGTPSASPSFSESPYVIPTMSEEPSADPSLPTEPSTEPAVPSETPVVEPTPTPEAAAFTCWSGDTVNDLSKCPAVSTKDDAVNYLYYVFPELGEVSESIPNGCEVKNPKTSGDMDGKAYRALNVYLWCNIADDTWVSYRYWADPADSDELFSYRFKNNTRASYDVYLVGSEDIIGWGKSIKKRDSNNYNLLNTAVIFGDGHLSVSVFADNLADISSTFASIAAHYPSHFTGYSGNVEPPYGYFDLIELD
jgi:hypothetical protein